MRNFLNLPLPLSHQLSSKAGWWQYVKIFRDTIAFSLPEKQKSKKLQHILPPKINQILTFYPLLFHICTSDHLSSVLQITCHCFMCHSFLVNLDGESQCVEERAKNFLKFLTHAQQKKVKSSRYASREAQKYLLKSKGR